MLSTAQENRVGEWQTEALDLWSHSRALRALADTLAEQEDRDDLEAMRRAARELEQRLNRHALGLDFFTLNRLERPQPEPAA